MPWRKRIIPLSDNVHCSSPNSLSADGRGRFALMHGGRVQCVRKHSKQGPNDFTLGMRVEGADVTSTFWFHDSRFSRPLLVVATDRSAQSGKAHVEIWDTRSGKGSRLHSLTFGEDADELKFVKGVGSALQRDKKNVLLFGLSSGEVHGYVSNKKGQLEHSVTLIELCGPVVDIAGDCVLAAADECGNLVCWRSGETGWNVVHRDSVDDCCVALAVKGELVAAGYSSGVLMVQDLRRGVGGKIVTNANGITCVDVHQTRDLVLVGGWDCRVTLVGVDRDGMRVVMSVCLDAIVLGGRFDGFRTGKADMCLLLLERGFLLKLEEDEVEATQTAGSKK